MAIYKFIDSRDTAFLLATLFLYFFATGLEIPTYFFNYIPIICGSLVLGLFGIYTSSSLLLWPILIATGFFAVVYGLTSVSAVPYLLVPKAMLNWDQCKYFLKYLNCSGLDDVSASVVAISKTASCYNDIRTVEAYFIPCVCTFAFGMSFFVFLKSQLRMKADEEKGGQEKAPFNPFTIQMILVLTFLVFFLIFVSRAVGWFMWPQFFSTAEFIESLVVISVLTASLFLDDFRVPFFVLLLYSGVKAAMDFGYASYLSFYMKPNQWTVCFSILDALNPTWTSNGVVFKAFATSANNCFQGMRGATYIDILQNLSAAVLFTLLFFLYEAICSLESAVFEEVKRGLVKNLSPPVAKDIII